MGGHLGGEVPGLRLRPALGIQKNTQALRHLLKHPLLHCSSRPKPDALQKYHVPKEKRVNLHPRIQIPLRDGDGCHLRAFEGPCSPRAPT